ncbi:hypothetical protein JCM8547_004509 [Rhodosporidiobolus lusitaniae]
MFCPPDGLKGATSVFLIKFGHAYDRYSSSAQASQGLLRNLLGATFPFFGVWMYDKLGFPWASTLMGFLAGAFAIVPFVIIHYGAALHARSKVARATVPLERFAEREREKQEKTK